MPEPLRNRHRVTTLGRRVTTTATLLLALGAIPALGQDSVTVVAGARYSASGLKRTLLGSAYRELWTTPIRVPVLRPDTFAGGLVPLQRGQSLQTISLRFQAPDGRQYVFRSVDKEQATALPVDLQNTVVSTIAQDLVSGKHPGAALVVAGLLEAAGVIHATPQFVVLASHPVLGEHREAFSGWLGMLEERPDEVEQGPGFGGYPRIIGSERLFERIEESSEDRVDARAFLRARLMDVLVGDWDRHPDQWRWAEEEREGVRWWLPIPRDRDNAFSHIEGAVSVLAGAFLPTTMRFEERYASLYGLIYNAQPLDRRFLSELPLAVWDSVATDLQKRLSDAAIAAAVDRLPREWQPLEAAPLSAKLRARRDDLPEVAREIYSMLAREVEVHATNQADLAEVERLPDGTLRVRVSRVGSPERVYFDRTFLPQETREVRVHLHGGADRARVHGSGEGISVRVIAGAGDDLLEDSSSAGALTAFYDHQGDNRFVLTRRTRVDGRPYEPPLPSDGLAENAPGPRDWGIGGSLFNPYATWRSQIGPVIGGGPRSTRYGFRRTPFAAQTDLRVVFAPLHLRMGLEAEARLLRTGGGGETRLAGRVSQLSVTRFAGFGNEAPEEPERDLYTVWATEYAASLDLVAELTRGVFFSAGPAVLFLDPEPRAESPAAAAGVPGGDPYGLAGLSLGGAADRRDSAGYPRRGFQLTGSLVAFPLITGDAGEPFSRGSAVASGYLPLPGPLQPLLAARAGGEQVWGSAPLQYSAFIGGSSSVRGLPRQRYAGNAATYGSLELRTTLGRANLRVARPEIGAIALADAGRVYAAGEESNLWHTGYGGGLWIGAFGRSRTAHLLYVRGEHHTIHAGLGLPF